MPKEPSTIIAMTSDLFLQSRISEIAGSLKVKAEFAGTFDALRGKLSSWTRLVVLDLASEDYDPFTVAKTVKTNRPGLQVLGFFPHVKTDLKARAEEAGIDVVVPNSKFVEALRNILKEANT